MIVSGSESQILAARLADVTGGRLARVEFKRFPDGELKVRVPDPSADRGVIVASTPSCDAHIELLQLQDALRAAGVQEIVTVMPFMGYARQSKVFETGDPISARAMARAVSTGTDRVLTVEPHKTDVVDLFDVPASTVKAGDLLAEPLPGDLTEPMFVSPDEESTYLAEAARNAYGRGESNHFEKTRHTSTDVEIEPRDVDVTGRDVVLTDDIIATGSTMSEAVDVLQAKDAARVFVTCVHPILMSNAVLKLSDAGVDAIYGTDTLERTVSEVSVAPAIADAL
ncbi:MAG: ribose-phosphate diphosphokinase [Halapricum sp.]